MSKRWTRRDVLKSGLAASAAAWLPGGAAPAGIAPPSDDMPPTATPGGLDAAASARERLLLDFGWRFHLGHANDPAQDFGWGQGRMLAKTGVVFTPSREDFNDRSWAQVDLPHDWAVDLPFQNVPELIEFGAKPLGRAYPATSIGWYRRVFDIPATDVGRRLSLEFDGVFRDCLVALNGHLLGGNASGYAPFRFDITDYATYGGRNILVVRVDATGREGWFYEGAGIYRHTWLVKTSAVHVPQWGTFVSADVQRDSAHLTIATEVVNESDRAVTCHVVSTVTDPAGKAAGTARSLPLRLAAQGQSTVTQQVHVTSPQLWFIERPRLYTLVTSIEVNGAERDRYETPFGIRTLRFDPNLGFLLNEQRVELKGTCNHQDHAGVGSALPDRLQSYRIEKLKAMGSNAYRTSHNPPTAELLDACDRLGMVVLDETRLFAATPEGRSQLERMIRRDRNHPSVFCWSISNEEWAEQGTERGVRIATELRALAHSLDPSRPVTAAMDSSWGKGISAVVDVQGCNYETPSNPDKNVDTFHQRFPKQPMMGTEVASTLCTRGIYANDKERGYVSAYDVNAPYWGATAEQWWGRFATRQYLAGGFVWTGFDYRGEPTPYAWPCISSHFGIMDTCGFPKDNYFYYQAWWGTHPVLHLFPHWNWPGKEGQEIDVWVHSNLERVELFLNGKSLGGQAVKPNEHLAWKVPYEPGRLEARGFRSGQQVLTSPRETAGPAARVEIAADRARIDADGEDVVVISATVLDTQGRLVPTADHEVAFRVSGNGKLIGMGNGDPSSHESDKGTTRRAFNGLCLAIVQATKEPGEIRIDASSAGLGSGSVSVLTQRVPLRPSVSVVS